MTEKQGNVTLFTLNWIDKYSNDLKGKSGLYQLYGDSPIYGRNQLLYIGQTKDLKTRPEEHEELKRINGLSVRYALCSIEDLDFIESLLIVTHKPSYNSQCLIAPKAIKTGTLSYLYNEGERGSLVLEVSNYYWCWD